MAEQRTRAVFLDRDGVLNAPVVRHGKPYPPANIAELELLPGVRQACEMLRSSGLLLLVVTNQPDIARGTARRTDVEAINASLCRELGITEVLMCPHDDGDHCDCRKPSPGLLYDGAERYGVDLSSSVMVGDRWRDIEAGRTAGCRTVFIDWKYEERRPSDPDLTVSALYEAVDWIILHANNKI